MKKFKVTWKEIRTIKCVAEIEAETPQRAVELAQNYEADVDETELTTDDILKGRAEEIEPEDA